jgi:hypothetical protein
MPQYDSSQRTKAFATMPETIKIVLMILFVLGALFLTLRITAWKMKKACDLIIRDLKVKKAFAPASAVDLPYAKNRLINIGLRDYRPSALDELIKEDVVRILEGERYYLREGYKTQRMDDRTAT